MAEYWRELFASLRFRMFDPFRPLLWHDERVAIYYRQNLFVFIHDEFLSSNPALLRLPEVKDGEGLMLIAACVLYDNLGLRATLKRLPHLLWNRLWERVRRLFVNRTDAKETWPENGSASPKP